MGLSNISTSTAVTNVTHQSSNGFFDLAQNLRSMSQVATRRVQTTMQNQTLLSSTALGLSAGLLSGSASVFRHTINPQLLQTLLQELTTFVPMAFEQCRNHPYLTFSNALKQQFQTSVHHHYFELYFQSDAGRSLLHLCEQALTQHWSVAQLNEALVRSQYQSFDSQHFSSSSLFRQFMGQQDEQGSNFARIILSAYTGHSSSQISEGLKNYIETQGVLSGVLQTASLSGIVSGWSGRLLSTALIGFISRSHNSPIVKVGSALLCGALGALGQVGFQVFWATRHLNRGDRLNAIKSMEWDFKSAIITGMICGLSELIGAQLLDKVFARFQSGFLQQSLRTFLNFAVFNVSAELASDNLMNRVGVESSYINDQQDVLAVQTLSGQWVMGALQEIIGDRSSHAPSQVFHFASQGITLALSALLVNATPASNYSVIQTQNSLNHEGFLSQIASDVEVTLNQLKFAASSILSQLHMTAPWVCGMQQWIQSINNSHSPLATASVFGNHTSVSILWGAIVVGMSALAHTKLVSFYQIIDRRRKIAPAMIEVVQFLNSIHLGEVESRIKDEKSIRDKILRHSITDLNALVDLAGVRIVVDTPDKVEEVFWSIMHKYGNQIQDRVDFDGCLQFTVPEAGPADGKSYSWREIAVQNVRVHDRESGYRALHVVVEINSNGVLFPVEIQVLTKWQNDWKRIQDEAYKCSIKFDQKIINLRNQFFKAASDYLHDLEIGNHRNFKIPDATLLKEAISYLEDDSHCVHLALQILKMEKVLNKATRAFKRNAHVVIPYGHSYNREDNQPSGLALISVY